MNKHLMQFIGAFGDGVPDSNDAFGVQTGLDGEQYDSNGKLLTPDQQDDYLNSKGDYSSSDQHPYKDPDFWTKLFNPQEAERANNANFEYGERPLVAAQQLGFQKDEWTAKNDFQKQEAEAERQRRYDINKTSLEQNGLPVPSYETFEGLQGGADNATALAQENQKIAEMKLGLPVQRASLAGKTLFNEDLNADNTRDELSYDRANDIPKLTSARKLSDLNYGIANDAAESSLIPSRTASQLADYDANITLKPRQVANQLNTYEDSQHQHDLEAANRYLTDPTAHNVAAGKLLESDEMAPDKTPFRTKITYGEDGMPKETLVPSPNYVDMMANMNGEMGNYGSALKNTLGQLNPGVIKGTNAPARTVTPLSGDRASVKPTVQDVTSTMQDLGLIKDDEIYKQNGRYRARISPEQEEALVRSKLPELRAINAKSRGGKYTSLIQSLQ